MRGLSKVFGLGCFLFAAAVPSMAMAEENNAELCNAQLSELGDARSTLDQLEASIAQSKAERAELKVRDAELAAEIPLAEGAQRKALLAERAAVELELGAIAELLPVIEAQAEALRVDIESAERAYIGCIEATIE
jgi:hypothetical protein